MSATGVTALVQQDDDRLDPLLLEVRHERVHRIGFVVEVDVGRGGRRHDVGRALQRHADDGDLDSRELVDGERREDRLAGVLVGHIGGEELEVGSLEPVTGEASLHRVAAALLHTRQLGRSFVELVVPDAVVIEADQVHRLDRRLVVEDRRNERGGPDEVAGGHEQRVRIRGPQVADIAGQILGTARGCIPDATTRALWRTELPMEVVEGQDLHVRRLGVLFALPTRRRLCRHHRRDRCRSDEHNCREMPALHPVSSTCHPAGPGSEAGNYRTRWHHAHRGSMPERPPFEVRRQECATASVARSKRSVTTVRAERIARRRRLAARPRPSP